MRSRYRVLLALALLNGVASFQATFADAEPYDLTAADAAYDRFDLDAAIPLYTQAIESGAFSGEALAVLHIKRGVAYGFNDDHINALANFNSALDHAPHHPWALYNRARTLTQLEIYGRALNDANEVIALRPDVSESYLMRARLSQRMRNFKLALADCDMADRLKPASRDVYLTRGYTFNLLGEYDRAAYEYEMAGLISSQYRSDADEGLGISKLALGKFGDAAGDFSRRLKDAKSLAYWSLWLHVARSRAGKADPAELKRALAQDTAPGAWPEPILRYFAGELKADKLRALAATGEEPTRKFQQCSAEFFIGQRELIDGHKKSAKSIFEKVVSICDVAYFERIVAQAELKRLNAK